MKGSIFIISGPSGAGKSTILKKILNELENFIFSVSFTTRKPREGEINGKDYFFVDRKTFEEMIEKDEFLEWEEVHGNLYGTPKKFIYDNIEKNKNVILDVDVKGALNVKKHFQDAILIYIAPPSYEVLKERLKSRGTEDKEALERRLNNAKWELNQMEKFDFLIINENIEKACLELKSVLISETLKIEKRKDLVEKIKNEIK